MKWLWTVGALTAMALMTCSGCGSTGGEKPQAGTKEAVEAIKEIGGKVEYYDQSDTQPVKEVDLSDNQKITKEICEHLGRLDRVNELKLNGSNVTDECLSQLKGMKSLTILDISGTEITDAGLAHLEGLTNLSTLEVGSKVTKEGTDKLKKAIPELKIR
jgi:hypothetical protein